MAVFLCPKDGAGTHLERQSGRRGAFILDVCPRCGGVWYDRGEIAKLTGDREIERLLVDYAAGASGLPCPRCGQAMARRPVGAVTVDVCTKCRGVWFDRRELEVAASTLADEAHRLPRGTSPGSGITHSEALSLAAFASPSLLRRLLEPGPPRIPPPEEL